MTLKVHNGIAPCSLLTPTPRTSQVTTLYNNDDSAHTLCLYDGYYGLKTR